MPLVFTEDQIQSFTAKNKMMFLCTENANALLFGNANKTLVYSHIIHTVTLLMVFLISLMDWILLYFCWN